MMTLLLLKKIQSIQIFLVLFVLPTLLFSQKSNSEPKIYTKEIALQVDNDVFLSFSKDKYYSSGIYIFYKWLHKNQENKKIIRSLSLGQRMFTPNNILLTNPIDFDRPYAGTFSAFVGQDLYKEKFYLSTKLELGWMGPGSMVGDFHEAWHDSFGFSPPNGWKYQIENSPIVNFYGVFTRPILTTKNFDLLAESSASAGTLFNNIRQDFVVRLGKINPINQSVHYQSKLGNDLSSDSNQELYLFLQSGLGYNFYNSTIEGNWIGNESPHTEAPENEVWYNMVGLKIACSSFDVSATVVHNSKETEESENHTYMSIVLSKRFY